MNKIFYPYLDEFMLVYLLHVIFVYIESLEKHADHLWIIFRLLRGNELYVKREKCAFGKEDVSSLGTSLSMDKFEWIQKMLKLSTNESHQQRCVNFSMVLFNIINYCYYFLIEYKKECNAIDQNS